LAGAAPSRARLCAGRLSRRSTLVAVCALLGLLTGCGDVLPFGSLIGSPGSTAEGVDGARATEAANAVDPAVFKAQTLLAKLGYNPGQADGVDGPRTRAAVSNYQTDTGLAVDGRISPELLGHLESHLREFGVAAGAPRLKASRPPDYQPGDSFIYSDGRVETVVEVDGDTVRWQNNRGTVYRANRDFVLPRASWVSTDRRGQTRVSRAREALWPLEHGKETSFSAATVVQIGDRPDNTSEYTEDWHCRVEGTEKISVIAGTFDTLKVVCRRAARDSEPQLTRVWYYAPRIGHYVRVNDLYEVEEQDRHIELVAIQPDGRDWPPAARAGLDWAVQHALESMSSEEQIEWSSSAVETRVTIKAHARFERGDGKICRNFLQIWTDKRARYSYPGTACREAEMRWQVPGVVDGAAKARTMLGGRS
jgi:peptidoglycan hydrolase-like protein with peptidoglycan-binding domain